MEQGRERCMDRDVGEEILGRAVEEGDVFLQNCMKFSNNYFETF